MTASRSEPLVCLGAFAGAHGVRGLVRVKPFTAEPEGVAAYGPVCNEDGSRQWSLALRGTGPKGLLVVEVAGITDRDRAEALKGQAFFVPRGALPAPEEDEFFHADLIGLEARLGDGTRLGTVRAVDDFGAGDVIEVADGPFGTVVVPFTKAVVPVVDIKAGRLVIDPPPGLLAANDEERK